MAFVMLTSLLLLEEKQEELQKNRVKRRILRDSSNPLELAESKFVEYFGLNKVGFEWILNTIKPHYKHTTIPLPIQLAATLRFFTAGICQQHVEDDSVFSLGRTTFCKTLNKMISILEEMVCPHWLQPLTDSEEILKSKKYFRDSYGIPDVIGCIDGCHIKLTKPTTNDDLYYNRCGQYSINAMIICDYKMNIRAVDATRPGSSEDSFVWNHSQHKDFYKSRYENDDCDSWLLADAAYKLEPYVLTPYNGLVTDAAQLNFNKAHAKARNVIRLTIEILKSRFKCLSKRLRYKPSKVAKIIHISCALYNMCNFYNVKQSIRIKRFKSDEEDELECKERIFKDSSNKVARKYRDKIAQRLLIE
ncbi:putative nuclease HARBI1 [Stomoxys calcitrans]|uniref:putative nuclease HARBI1 n=1 Tax=Stomoxys calcitrans TaxID=35570 RepID=UPI0027E2BB1B|nr:putative nuclease HARBI1 [Stomoxys calcitrans]XP_013118381.2 putative nuclease HARBI1 [Stomoxys calcitrans]